MYAEMHVIVRAHTNTAEANMVSERSSALNTRKIRISEAGMGQVHTKNHMTA